MYSRSVPQCYCYSNFPCISEVFCNAISIVHYLFTSIFFKNYFTNIFFPNCLPCLHNLRKIHIHTTNAERKHKMLFPKEYPYKLRRVARKIKKYKTYYTNCKSKKMVCKQVVKDPRLIALIDYFYEVTANIKQTKQQQEEMQMILDNAAEYTNVFCLTQIKINHTRYDNKAYVLSKERRKMLLLIKQINFCFFKLFTAEALGTIEENYT